MRLGRQKSLLGIYTLQQFSLPYSLGSVVLICSCPSSNFSTLCTRQGRKSCFCVRGYTCLLQLLFTLPADRQGTVNVFFFCKMLRGNFKKENHLESDSGALTQTSRAFEMFSGIQNFCKGMTTLTWTFLTSLLSEAGGLKGHFRAS